MIIIPAIDIINSKAVRLYKGDYNKEEIISSDIISLAKKFEADGATYIHVVDLDGAKSGMISNLSAIKDIASSVNINIEVGGGIRNIQSIESLLNIGVSRIILGTSAIKNKIFLKTAIDKYGDKIAVGVDFKGTKVCTNGWLEKSEVNYIDFCRELQNIGVKNIIVTDISKDGTLKGLNFKALLELSKILDINITASGGVSSMEDIKKLNKMNLYGVITGKAIYSNRLNLKEAIEITNNKGGIYMQGKKIIPCLDMKDGKVVKGINFVNIKEVGDVIEIAKRYCNDGADELVFLDIAATNEQRKHRKDLVMDIVKNINIPLTVGGGIKSLQDIEEIFESGANKVGINSEAIKNKKFLKSAIDKYGAEKIVLALDGKRISENQWNVVVNGGIVDTGIDAIEWAKEASLLGVKEILLTSLDEDGEKKGYDLKFTKAIKDATGATVIASGGCGCLEDFYDVLKDDIADCALAASVFHFNEIKIPELKKYLKKKGIVLYKEL